jgi:hypothetical protein
MRYVKTIEDFVRTNVHRSSHNCYITCDEYASVWRFTAKVCGWALPSALDWSYKKREYRNYEDAKQAFLSDLSIKTW